MIGNTIALRYASNSGCYLRVDRRGRWIQSMDGSTTLPMDQASTDALRRLRENHVFWFPSCGTIGGLMCSRACTTIQTKSKRCQFRSLYSRIGTCSGYEGTLRIIT